MASGVSLYREWAEKVVTAISSHPWPAGCDGVVYFIPIVHFLNVKAVALKRLGQRVGGADICELQVQAVVAVHIKRVTATCAAAHVNAGIHITCCQQVSLQHSNTAEGPHQTHDASPGQRACGTTSY
jgi:hypothetical protein